MLSHELVKLSSGGYSRFPEPAAGIPALGIAVFVDNGLIAFSGLFPVLVFHVGFTQNEVGCSHIVKGPVIESLILCGVGGQGSLLFVGLSAIECDAFLGIDKRVGNVVSA